MEPKILKSDQLDIIRAVRANLLEFMERNESPWVGLCSLFSDVIDDKYKVYIGYETIMDYIPLFTRSNAIKHANGYRSSTYWWGSSLNFARYDFTNRILFLDWIESQLVKQ